MRPWPNEEIPDQMGDCHATKEQRLAMTAE